MKNLRRMLQRSGKLLSGKNRRKERSRRHGLGRLLASESLESRQLLAGDVGTGLLSSDFAPFHNESNPFDVNADQTISPLDALLVINELSNGGGVEGEFTAQSTEIDNFYDVNADQAITPLDALLVINSLSVGEPEATPDFTLALEALRDPDVGTPGVNDPVNNIGNTTETSVQVGDIFNLEVSFIDERLFFPDPGLFALSVSINPDSDGAIVPVTSESQVFVFPTIDELIALVGSSPDSQILATQGGNSTLIPLSDLASSATGAVTTALVGLGISEDDFAATGVLAGTPLVSNGGTEEDTGDDEIGVSVLFQGALAGQEIENISFAVVDADQNPVLPVETIENAAGDLSATALALNLDFSSRSLPGNTPFFAFGLPTGDDFDPSVGVISVGGTTLQSSSPAVIGTPFDVFSFPVQATAPGTLTLTVTPFDDNATVAFPDQGIPASGVAPGVLTILIEPSDDAVVVNDDINLIFDEDEPDPNVFSLDLAGEITNGVSPVFALDTVVGVNGTPTLDGSVLTFTPNLDAFGTEEVVFSVTDGGLTQQGTVTVTINPINDPPVAVDDDGFTTPFETALSIPVATLLADDTDVDNDAGDLSITAVGSPVGGTVALVGDDVVFTPATGFSGPAQFEYTLSDGEATDTAIVTLTVEAEILVAPVANDGVLVVDEDDSETIDLATLLGGGTIDTLAITTPPALGDAVLAGTVLTFTPDADLFGSDELVFTATNSVGSDSGTISITINPVNDAPVAGDDPAATDENTPLVIPVADLLADDSAGPANETSDVLSIVAVSPTSALGGTVVLDAVAGTITYTPPVDVPLSPTNAVAPAADSFTYTVDDGSGAANSEATGTVNVTINNVLAAPVFVDPIPALTTNDLTPLTVDLDDLIVDNAADSFAVVTPPAVAAGSVVIDPVTNELTFTPVTGFEGNAVIEVSATNAAETTNAILTVEVNQNAAPVSPDVVVNATEDTPVTFPAALLLVDASAGSEEEDNVQSVVITAVGVGSEGGTAELNAAGGIDYDPADNFFGLETFEITITDDGDPSASGTFTLTVNVAAVNDPPIANNLTLSVDEAGDVISEDTPAIITLDQILTSSAANVGGGPLEEAIQTLSITGIGLGSEGGTALVNSDGGIDFTPAQDFFGNEEFVVTLTDSGQPGTPDDGESVAVTLTVSVASVNDPPVVADIANFDPGPVLTGGSITFDVLDLVGEAPFEAGESFSVAAASDDGIVNVDPATSAITFEPEDGFVGTAEIVVTVTDSLGAAAAATIEIVVQDFVPTTVAGSIFIDNIDNIEEVLDGGAPSRNGIQDEIDAGVGGILVEVMDSTGAVVAAVITAADGSFAVEDLPPGTYTIVYGVPGVFTPLSPTVTTFIASGDGTTPATVDAGLPLSGIESPNLQAVSLLSSSYLRANEFVSASSNGGREGAVVAFDDVGNQEFFIAGEGFDGVLFSEVVLADDLESALLVIIREGSLTPEVAALDVENFVTTADGLGMQFFGGLDDFDFVPVTGDPISIEFANFQEAVDRALAQL